MSKYDDLQISFGSTHKIDANSVQPYEQIDELIDFLCVICNKCYVCEKICNNVIGNICFSCSNINLHITKYHQLINALEKLPLTSMQYLKMQLDKLLSIIKCCDNIFCHNAYYCAKIFFLNLIYHHFRSDFWHKIKYWLFDINVFVLLHLDFKGALIFVDYSVTKYQLLIKCILEYEHNVNFNIVLDVRNNSQHYNKKCNEPVIFINYKLPYAAINKQNIQLRVKTAMENIISKCIPLYNNVNDVEKKHKKCIKLYIKHGR